jgi:hypothetical protein
MKLEDAFPYTFHNLRRQLGIPEPDGRSLIDLCRSDESYLCRQMMATYGLTAEQMHQAADRYCLGCSKSGKPIYWMIDDNGICRDGHIADSWVSQMLKLRYPDLARYVQPRHCLFGLHLLSPAYQSLLPSDGRLPICIVEKESSAIILSEVYTQSLWMAYVCPANFNEHLLAPLRGRQVILFPNADTTMSNYLYAMEIADQAQHRYQLDVTVQSLLEVHASDDQKLRKIDLADYYLESIKNSATIQTK